MAVCALLIVLDYKCDRNSYLHKVRQQSIASRDSRSCQQSYYRPKAAKHKQVDDRRCDL